MGIDALTFLALLFFKYIYQLCFGFTYTNRPSPSKTWIMNAWHFGNDYCYRLGCDWLYNQQLPDGCLNKANSQMELIKSNDDCSKSHYLLKQFRLYYIPSFIPVNHRQRNSFVMPIAIEISWEIRNVQFGCYLNDSVWIHGSVHNGANFTI